MTDLERVAAVAVALANVDAALNQMEGGAAHYMSEATKAAENPEVTLALWRAAYAGAQRVTNATAAMVAVLEQCAKERT